MEKSLNEDTYEKLKYDIMNFKLVPGDSISAQKIAVRYNVSRTPAREAIVNLEKEGLLKIIPQSGTYVASINCRRFEQEWFVRKSLEVGMVDPVFEHVSNEMLDKMEELNSRLINYDKSNEKVPRIEIDNAFHELIYESSGEQLAANIIKMQMSHYNRIRFLAELNSSISVKTNEEHEMLIDAIRKKDKRMYLRVIKGHITTIWIPEINRYPDGCFYLLNHFSILRRSHVFDFFEKLGEIINICNSTLYSNVLYRKLGCIEQIDSVFNTFIINKISER